MSPTAPSVAGTVNENEFFEPPPYVYSKDPWDVRRFYLFNPIARWLRGETSGWEAATPFLLVGGGLLVLVLAVVLINALAR